MIFLRDYNIRDFNKMKDRLTGNGGNIFLLTPSNKKFITSYVVKDNREQSINEYIAQHLLKALGFNCVPVELIQFGKLVHGAVAYKNDLKCTGIMDDNLSKSQLQMVIELFYLSAILENSDSCESFLDSNGDIYSLNYGEAMISPFILRIVFAGKPDLVGKILNSNNHKEKVRNWIDSAIRVLGEKSKSNNRLTPEIITDSLKSVIIKVASLDLSLMTSCFQSIDTAYYKGASNVYLEYFSSLKEIALDYLEAESNA